MGQGAVGITAGAIVQRIRQEMLWRGREAGEPLRVLHVFSGDLWAGAEVMICHLLETLRDQPGVTLMALALNEGRLTERLRAAGIDTVVVPESGRSFPVLCWEAIRACRGRRIEVVHAHRYKENLLAWIVAVALKVQVRLSTMHGMPEMYGPAQRIRARVKVWLNLALLRRGFSMVVAVSHEIDHTLRGRHAFPASRVEVIHNGIPLPEIPGLDDGQGVREERGKKVIIGTIGRCVPVKGFDLFIEIAERVCQRMDQAVFVLVGEGPEKWKLEQAVAAKGLEGRVLLFPACVDPSPHYRSFDIYLNTSLHEGIPLTILEAMAWGKPVVAANVGGIPEVVSHQETGFLVDGRDPEAFSAWCCALAQDRALRSMVGARARAAVAERFSVQKMAVSYAALYARLARAAAVAPVLECGAGCR